MRLWFLIVALVAAVVGCHMRWSMATTRTLQCDEIPLLTRLTGLCGRVTNDVEAASFTPSYYTAYHGAMRSLRPPKELYTTHTSTAFWTNLTVHLFGASKVAARAAPLFWSIAAIFTTAWATWIARRSHLACCVAAWVVALSPCGIFYASEARGYAEALALTPLLLVAIYYVRRKSSSDLWAGLILLIGLQLALTVYTMWVFWVFPSVLIAVLFWHKLKTEGEGDSADSPRRGPLVIAVVGLVVCVGVYTVDRWQHLTMQATKMGLVLDSFDKVIAFCRDLLSYMLPLPAWLGLVGVLGVWAILRSDRRWWLLFAVGGVVMPLALTVVNGSPGYRRNLIHLLVILAILIGVGADWIVRWLVSRVGGRRGMVVAGLGFTALTAPACVTLNKQVEAIDLADWGTATLDVCKLPEEVGPRWICPCQVCHWQINWYCGPVNIDGILAVPENGTIEVAMIAEVDRDGSSHIYRDFPAESVLRREPLPAYLASFKPADTGFKTETRRWKATRFSPATPIDVEVDDPVFVMLPDRFSDTQWRRFSEATGCYEAGSVEFKSRQGLLSMIVPGSILPAVLHSIPSDLAIPQEEIRCFMLTRLEGV